MASFQLEISVFENGKLVATGARREDDLGAVLGNVIEILTESGVVEEA